MVSSEKRKKEADENQYSLTSFPIEIVVNPNGSRAYDLEMAQNIEDELAHCTGTLQWYRYGQHFFTDGVFLLAERCSANWLLLMVFWSQDRPEVGREEFQVWKFLPNPNDLGAVFVCEDGDGHEISRHEFVKTDFPLPNGITLYFSDNILCLPSER